MPSAVGRCLRFVDLASKYEQLHVPQTPARRIDSTRQGLDVCVHGKRCMNLPHSYTSHLEVLKEIPCINPPLVKRLVSGACLHAGAKG